VEVVRALIVPNLKEYEGLVQDALESADEGKRREGEVMVQALMEAVMSLEGEGVGDVSGFANGHAGEMKQGLEDKIGGMWADKVFEVGKPRVLKAVMECLD